ncbi:hypothetical protein E2C01_042028 [Portunus trituberculatus]|uniref:Uncharacterized protein n=1 Tax=Portunus trituberculatus TaxID=210409 RepID=A0A5B7FKP7_PORTR|nr:hypothetical protein [Portunus trituberculatus]
MVRSAWPHLHHAREKARIHVQAGEMRTGTEKMNLPRLSHQPTTATKTNKVGSSQQV